MRRDAESGSRIARLLTRRWSEVAATESVLRSELDAVLAGSTASPSLVRRLAPILGMHTADLFVIAGLELAEDLVAASGTGSWHVGTVLERAAGLSPRSLRRLHEFVRSLREHPPAWPPVPPPHSYPLGPGEMLLRLLRNRNIRPYSPKVLYFIGDGPIVSYSTMAMLGPGRTQLTPQYVTAFATVLGVPENDLAAIVGVSPCRLWRAARSGLKIGVGRSLTSSRIGPLRSWVSRTRAAAPRALHCCFEHAS